jgi:hypothetical protein
MVADHQGDGDQGRMMMADGSFGSRLRENSDASLQSRIFASTSGNQSREIPPTSIVAARRTKRFSVPLVKTRFHTAWVTDCLRNYVGIATGSPQIAADLLQRPSRQSRARFGQHRIRTYPPIRQRV